MGLLWVWNIEFSDKLLNVQFESASRATIMAGALFLPRVAWFERLALWEPIEFIKNSMAGADRLVKVFIYVDLTVIHLLEWDGGVFYEKKCWPQIHSRLP